MKTWSRAIVATVLMGTSVQGVSAEGRDVTREGMDALKDIGAALRGLDAYEVQMKVTTRVVAADSGKYRDVVGNVHYIVKPPSHLFASLEGAAGERRVFYDGQTMTVYSPVDHRYASVEAPGTIGTLIETARANRGVELPVATLFAWGTPGGPLSNVDRGRYEGAGMIHGHPCESYSYDEAGITWDVWVDGQDHLPCKLVRVDTEGAGLQGYRAEMDWTPEARISDDVFRFAPGAGDTRVELSEIAQGGAGGMP